MIFEKRHEWVEYPTSDPGDIFPDWVPENAGFKARILANPSGSEVRNETQHYAASNGTDLDAQDAYWQHIAPRIVEWNLQTPDGKDIPPPAEDWQILLDLPFDVQMWLRLTVHWTHRKKVLTSLQGRATTTDTTPPTPLHQVS